MKYICIKKFLLLNRRRRNFHFYILNFNYPVFKPVQTGFLFYKVKNISQELVSSNFVNKKANELTCVLKTNCPHQSQALRSRNLHPSSKTYREYLTKGQTQKMVKIQAEKFRRGAKCCFGIPLALPERHLTMFGVFIPFENFYFRETE